MICAECGATMLGAMFAHPDEDDGHALKDIVYACPNPSCGDVEELLPDEEDVAHFGADN